MAEPVIDESLCIGCGACEAVCPARPKKAMYVEGLAVHEKITLASSKPVEIKDDKGKFPF